MQLQLLYQRKLNWGGVSQGTIDVSERARTEDKAEGYQEKNTYDRSVLFFSLDRGISPPMFNGSEEKVHKGIKVYTRKENA
jgi:hypothetical protein